MKASTSSEQVRRTVGACRERNRSTAAARAIADGERNGIARPPVAVPVVTATAPLLPLEVVPVVNSTLPLTPAVSPLAEANVIDPLELAVAMPLVIAMAPPAVPLV